jgi:hypothetical protein
MRTQAAEARRSVVLTVLVGLLLRLSFTCRPAYPDEAG